MQFISSYATRQKNFIFIARQKFFNGVVYPKLVFFWYMLMALKRTNLRFYKLKAFKKTGGKKTPSHLLSTQQTR